MYELYDNATSDHQVAQCGFAIFLQRLAQKKLRVKPCSYSSAWHPQLLALSLFFGRLFIVLQENFGPSLNGFDEDI